MQVPSLSFLGFLLVTLVLCLSVGRGSRQAGRKVLALAGVVFTVLGGGWRGFAVLAAGTAATAAVLWCLERRDALPRRLAMAMGCLWHIAVLAVCKLTGWMPLGISFFTFQQLWLLKEAYTGQYRRSQGDSLLLYTFFFPTVTSGPILRPEEFFPQLREAFLCPSWGDAAAGLYAISFGMAKKVLLADPLGAVVSNGWALGQELTAPAAWIVILGYTLRLYLDFSGYCDIASGCARLLGIRLPVNFDSPYRALSVGEFWKRWHITLTSFLRECVYIPLGGSRRGSVRTYGNILIVYLISGLWHGTGWTFLVWGLLHGLAQVGERLWGRRRERLPKGLRWAMTFLFVNLAWVFFQAPSLGAAGMLLRSAVCGGWGLPLETLAAGALDSEAAALRTLLPALESWVPGLVVGGLLCVGLAVSFRRENVIRRMETVSPKPVGALLCGGLLAWAVVSFSSTATFIYSNF